MLESPALYYAVKNVMSCEHNLLTYCQRVRLQLDLILSYCTSSTPSLGAEFPELNFVSGILIARLVQSPDCSAAVLFVLV